MTTSRSKAARTTFARLDITLPQSGIFRAVSHNPATASRAEVVFRMVHSDAVVEYRGVQCTHVDLRVLIVLCALAGLEKNPFDGRGEVPPFPALWSALSTHGTAQNLAALAVRTTLAEVLREAGMSDTGANRRRIVNCLIRLSMVRQFISVDARVRSGANLLGFEVDSSSGDLLVGVSPHIARAILFQYVPGSRSLQFARIDVDELRSVRDSAATIILVALSARVRPGGYAKYGIDALAQLAYGPTDNPATRRKRRARISEALEDLGGLLDWTIERSSANAVVIRRGGTARRSLSAGDERLSKGGRP
jgi:hypothetical protein